MFESIMLLAFLYAATSQLLPKRVQPMAVRVK